MTCRYHGRGEARSSNGELHEEEPAGAADPRADGQARPQPERRRRDGVSKHKLMVCRLDVWHHAPLTEFRLSVVVSSVSSLTHYHIVCIPDFATCSFRSYKRFPRVFPCPLSYHRVSPQKPSSSSSHHNLATPTRFLPGPTNLVFVICRTTRQPSCSRRLAWLWSAENDATYRRVSVVFLSVETNRPLRMRQTFRSSYMRRGKNAHSDPPAPPGSASSASALVLWSFSRDSPTPQPLPIDRSTHPFHSLAETAFIPATFL